MGEKKAAIADRVEEEHATLRTLMDNVLDAFARPPSKEFADWKLELVWQLRDFRNVLVKHFDLEEDGGFMGDVIAKAPQEKRRVDMLEAEHGEFLDELDGITGELKRMADVSTLPSVRDRLSGLVNKLHDHEASERDLMYSVYFRDIGVGD